MPKMPIERARSQSAAVHRRLAGAQPAAHGVARHAEAPRNTTDRHARTMQPSHLFVARLPLLAPLRPLSVALRGCCCLPVADGDMTAGGRQSRAALRSAPE